MSRRSLEVTPDGATSCAHCFAGFCDVGEFDESEGATFFIDSIASRTSPHLFSPTSPALRRWAIAAKSTCGSEYLGAISIGMVMWVTFSSMASSWSLPPEEMATILAFLAASLRMSSIVSSVLPDVLQTSTNVLERFTLGR